MTPEAKKFFLEDKYMLDGRTPVLATDFDAYVQWYASKERHVADTTINGVRVSTVFLTIDHDLTGKGPPVLFETMVFCPEGVLPDLNESQERYCTWEEAEAGHARWVERVRALATGTD